MFSYDLLVDNTNPTQYYIVDMNYFASYGGIPPESLEKSFKKLLLSKVKRKVSDEEGEGEESGEEEVKS